MLSNFFLCALLASSSLFSAIRMNVQGSPQFLINASHLEEGAGSDFKGNIDSNPGALQVILSESGINRPSDLKKEWNLLISANTLQLPNNCRLFAKIKYPINIQDDLSFIQTEWIPIDSNRQRLVTGRGLKGPFDIQLRIGSLQLKNITNTQLSARISFQLEGKRGNDFN
jgi:hypothetical protein